MSTTLALRSWEATSYVPVEFKYIDATSAAFVLGKMESAEDGSNHEEEEFFDAEDEAVPSETRVGEALELAPHTCGPTTERPPLATTPELHALRHQQTRARSSSRSSLRSTTAADLRSKILEETKRELPNLPPIPSQYLAQLKQHHKGARPASVALFPPAAARAEPPALRRAASAAGARDRPAPKPLNTIHPGPRRHAIAIEASDAQPKQQGRPGTLSSREPVHLPAISRRARAKTVHTSSTPTSKTTTPILLPGTAVARDRMDFYESHRSSAHTHAKRRSLPPDVDIYDRRPSTSGNIYTRPSSRLNTNRSADLQRHMDQYKSSTTRSSYQLGDAASVSGQSSSGRARRYSVVPDRSPLSPTRLRERLHSPEVPQYGRRRPSFGAPMSNTTSNQLTTLESPEESPAEESEPKLSESTSAESQPEDNVWDELDELKLRIKELEMKDKVPTVSSAAASGDSSDRPRTATTAPTTIDSSPKHERKREPERKKATPTPPLETPSGANALSNIHPPLHTALAKAETLLNASLYRTLEAASNDALQLAAVTGSAGPQGTNFSAASIINGLTVSDRHVRRKVDSMCRNLTELCIALCEGKHEASEMVSSPTSMETARQESPTFRYSENHAPSRSASNARPMSRLDARRSSILGGNSLVPYESISPRGSVGDMSATEQEPLSAKSNPPQLRRVSRAPSGLRSRIQRQDDISGDEETNLRPPSRAMTDIGALRPRSRLATENRSPGAQRTPSLREILASKRNNDAAFEGNRETPRVSSIGSEHRRRRLFDQQSTPPVVEEEDGPDDYHTPSQPRRRVTSLGGQFNSRRSIGDIPGRTSSLHQQRHVITE
ncbi:hypothetical protein PRZ48_001268 [Zasmidium cellare]|uniref:Uncharacterized protein n=1 Tax=Zasmidium cellare TaxID=395010 RepID=A0ABR0F371_ZASCE|nr:hypothetical protein PRZ48_001268 [Zasmidium cellare]